MSRLFGVPDFVLDGWERRWPRVARLVSASAAAALAAYLLWPFIHNDWDLIDDHEIPEMLNNSPPNNWHWYWKMLAGSEGARPGAFGRYRPAYYFLRITETWIFRSHAAYWYVSRAVMFGLAFALLMWILQRKLSVLENFCLVLWLGTFPWWADVFGRLGPVEAYAGWGLALYGFGVMRGLQAVGETETRARVFIGCAVALFIGGVVTTGSKESFVLLAVPSLYVVARARFKRPRLWLSISAAMHAVFSIFVAWATAAGIKRTGHVYREDTSFAERLGVVRRFIPIVWSDWKPWVLGVAALVAVALAVQLVRKQRDSAKKIAWVAAQAAAGALIIAGAYLSQVVFYNGAWPPGMGEYCCGRYSYPGMVMPALALWLGYWSVVRVAEAAAVPSPLSSLLRLLAVAWVLTIINKAGFPIRGVAAPMVARRAAIQKNLEAITRAARREPDLPVILVANTLWDYERVYAVPSFLRMYHVTSKIYLMPNVPRPEAWPAGSLERHLAELTYKLSNEGREGTISPMEFHGGACLGVGFQGGIGDLHCSLVASF